VGVGRERAAEVGCDGVVPAGVILDEDAVLVAAVHVAGYEVKFFAFCGFEEGEVAHAGDAAFTADGVYVPQATDLG
jgi:hypothetical protein